MEAIGGHAVALVRSLPEARRNADTLYPFRQSSDLYYLTGFAEPEATLVLRPGAASDRVVLFVRPRDPEQETWTGRRAGVDGAVAGYGVEAAYPVAELDQRLPDLIANTDDLYYTLGDDPDFDRQVAAIIARQRNEERRGRVPPRRIVDPREVLHELRLRKSEPEITLMRRAAEITAEAHRAAMKAAAPGVTEYQLQALIDYTFRHHGGAGPSYPTIVGGGDNGTILHYIENDRPLVDGELVLIDAGCEYQFYAADISRTFPVSGRFTPAQRRCYELVLAVEQEAIQMVRPGATISAIHDRCVELLAAGMVELGLLAGAAADRIADASYKRFYPHRTSHWLGMDVHDVGYYAPRGEPRPLEPGMVFTIEPGLYIPAATADVPAEYRGIGIRIEDDVLVTADGCEVLTAAAPKQIDEVEAACRGEWTPSREGPR
jgi:Xaa-Pro aminopeptidase